MISAAKHFIISALRLLCRKSEGTRSFLIPAYTGLGNFLLMTPMVRTLRERYPASRIYILAGNAFGGEHVFRAGDGIAEMWKRKYSKLFVTGQIHFSILNTVLP